MGQKDYYQVLGVERTADTQVIKEAYRKLAFQYHPDRNAGDPAAVERMKEINEAYAVLSDRDKRGRYDRLSDEYGSGAYDRFRQTYTDQDIFRGSDINQVFEEMARMFGFRGFDEVFREAYGGGYRSYTFQRPGVFGRFVIFGPGGAPAGERSVPGNSTWLGKVAGYAFRKLISKGAGKASGDRRGTIVLNAREAREGARVQYLDEKTGRTVAINVPPGMNTGHKIRLRGMGNPGWLGEPGDLYLEVQVRRPLMERLGELVARLGGSRRDTPAKR